METNLKDQDVLLVKEPQSEKLNVVSGIDTDGKLKTVPPKTENGPDFMRIDKHSNVLENFFSNFMRQAKDPSHFGFFKSSAEDVEQNATLYDALLKETNNEDATKMLNENKVNPEEYLQKSHKNTQSQPEGYKSYDESHIDWAKFEQIGISKASLEKNGALEQMLNYRKSPTLMDINANLGDVTIRTQARLSMRETEDGRIIPVIHAIRKQPELDRPFYGHSFSAEDKENLQKTGNLGRVVELTNRTTGEKIPSYVSIDKLTNELVSLRADRIRIPDDIKGVKLNDEQKQSLTEGKEIYLEGMKAKNGKDFNANVQFNADKRGIEFRFEENQHLNQSHTATQDNSKEFRIPNRLGEHQLSPEEQQKLKEGGTIYVKGLKDRKGQEYNAYIKVNDKEQKLDFYKWNPDRAKSKGNEITADNTSRTQVAVNSDGKNNEATKYSKEPVKHGKFESTSKERQQNRTKIKM